MSTFSAVQDMTNPTLVLESLQKVGDYFHQCQAAAPEAPSLSGLLLPDEAYKSAMGVFHPLANYLQNKADDSQKEELSEMLTDNSKIVDHLCEGLLYPYVKETSLHGPREITHTHALRVVLLFHVCLMECSGNQRMKRKLIECGCVFLLLKELRNMVRYIQADAESNKFSRQLIQSATLVVNNCLSDNIDFYMRLYPDTDIKGALASYFRYPDSIVRLVCQMTYYQFSHYLHQTSPGSVDCPAAISTYTQLLGTASQSKQFVARMDKLFVGATDLINTLCCLCASASNRNSLVESFEFRKAITNLLRGEGSKEAECALDLLLTYLTEGQPIAWGGRGSKEQPSEEDGRGKARKELLSHFPEVVHQLESVLTSEHHGDAVKKLCSAVLWCTQANPEDRSDVHRCLLYVECCYKYRHFGECCYWSDYASGSTSDEARELRDQFLLYKAKAKYHIYQRQHVVLRRAEALQSLGEMKQDRERVYENAKEVISILGFLKAKSFPLDIECEQFLDCALMDYVRELNKRSSKDSVYCMLCHKKQSMVRSHAIPESLLKIIFQKDRALVLMGPSSLDSRVKTLHTVTHSMLCSTCDNEVLSRDENIFIENIAKPIYRSSSTSEKIEKVPYDTRLHRFCAGLIFRNLALSRGVTGSANADKILKLFRYCRSVLMLSGQAAADAGHSIEDQSPPAVDEESKVSASEQKFGIAVFFTPGMLEDQPSGQRERPSNLIRALNSSIFNCLSQISISDSSTLARKHYFFAVHFGIFTIAAFLEPVPTKCQQFLINPCGGELVIPANSNRLSLIPPGLMKVFEEQTEKNVKRYVENLVEVKQGEKKVSLTVLKSNVEGSPMGSGPTSFSLLPPKFELNRQTNVMSMKEGHCILLHHTLQLPSASHTVFLAVEEAAPTKPYVIIHSYLCAPTMSQTFGYFFSLPEFAFKTELDASHKVIFQQMRDKDLDLFKLPAKVIPAKMEYAGLQNYQSILYHLNRNPVFDKKCDFDGCWYCSRKCDVCFLNSTAGLSFSVENDQEAKLTHRFHDEKCKAFSDCSRHFPSSFSLTEPQREVSIHLIPNDDGALSSEKTLTGMHLWSVRLSSYDEKNQCPTSTAVDIYRVKEGSDQIPSGCSVALFDVRTHRSQVFGEFFLTEDLRLDKPLPHARAVVDKELIQLVHDVIDEAIAKSGRDVTCVQSLCTQQIPERKSPETSPPDEIAPDNLDGLDGLFD